jgi:hypothetical protein
MEERTSPQQQVLVVDVKLLNPLNTKLNPICHLLALLGAHLIFYVSRIRGNLLKPTGHVMYQHQFNIQQLYALPTLYLCVLYLSESKQRLVPLTA